MIVLLKTGRKHLYYMSYIILGLLLYILYRFIFGFVIPVISASRKMQERMKDMQGNESNFNPHARDNGFGQSSTARKQSSSGPSSKDYIEFEEIK